MRDVSKRYGRREVLSGLSFNVNRGEVVGLLGRNGAGKTTTLRLLTALARASRGSVELFGEPIPARYSRVAKRVGAVIEEPGLVPGLSATEAVRIAAWQVGDRPTRGRIREVLEQVGLGDFSKRKVRGFSTGMKGRLAMACALVSSPDLLILDEPTAGLDPVGRRELRESLLQLSRAGVAVLVASHELSEVELSCDRVLLLEDGQCILEGRVDELLAPAQGVWVSLADWNLASATLAPFASEPPSLRDEWLLVKGLDTRDVLRLLSDVGLYPDDIRPLTMSLEDLFFAVTRGGPSR